jgi:WXG100 family type VII secretion target
MAEPSWNDVKAVLNDPNVSEDKKAELMHAYVSSTAPWNIPDEANTYKDRYDTSSLWDWGDNAGADGGLQSRYDEAKAEGETNSYNSQEQTKAVQDGQQDLDSKQPPASSGAGVKLSDELFDAGKAGLKVFEKFEGIWNNRPGDCIGNTTSINYAEQIQKPYDEQRGINFHKLLMEADEFSTAKTKIDEMKSDVDGQLKTLYGEWEGQAATKSHEHYTGQISPKVTELADAFEGAAKLTRTAVRNVYGLCKSKADEVLGMYREQIGQADTFMAEKVVSFARGEGDYSKDRVLEIAGWVDSKTGSNIADRIHSDDCSLNDENRDYAINQCKKWIRDSFNREFWQLYEQFKTCCTETKSSVDAQWETLASYMAEFDNPFPAPASDKGGDDKGGDDKGGGGKGGDKNGGGGGTGGGGTGGGGSGSGGGGTPSVPEMPKPPENPLDKDGDGKPDDVKLPGDTDGDGKIDDLDGDGKPDDQTGKPDGLKGEEEPPETVTIKSGDNEIKITEPDERGHVQITVDTPTSEPKTYDVDFSNNPDAAKALMGQNGGAALAGALAGATSTTGAVPGAAGGTPGAPGAAIGAVAGGAEGGANGAIPIEAGADGKALIELDGLAITAEVDPLTGEINLTVDNGDGTPEEYGVEFGEDTPDSGQTPGIPGMDNAVPLPADVPGSLPSDVTTMPAGVDPQIGQPEPAGVGVGGGGFTEPQFAPPSAADPGFAGGVGGGGFTEPQFTAPDPGFAGGGGGGGGFTEPQFTPMPAPDNSGFAGSVAAGAGAPLSGGFGFTEPSAFQAPAASFDGGSGGGTQYNTEGTTSTSGASVLGGSGFNGADSVLGGPSSSGSDNTWSNPPADSADQGLASDTNASQAGQAGSATLPSMQESQAAGQPGGGGMMGGGMMGGGMPGGGGQQGGGGDSERNSPGQWRTTGSLFDDDVALSRVQGVLGEEGR